MSNCDSFYIIQDNIIGTTKCNKNLICLKGDIICKTIFTNEENSFILLCQEKEDCINKFKFGELYYCKCNVRKEIYFKYGI